VVILLGLRLFYVSGCMLRRSSPREAGKGVRRPRAQPRACLYRRLVFLAAPISPASGSLSLESFSDPRSGLQRWYSCLDGGEAERRETRRDTRSRQSTAGDDKRTKQPLSDGKILASPDAQSSRSTTHASYRRIQSSCTRSRDSSGRSNNAHDEGQVAQAGSVRAGASRARSRCVAILSSHEVQIGWYLESGGKVVQLIRDGWVWDTGSAGGVGLVPWWGRGVEDGGLHVMLRGLAMMMCDYCSPRELVVKSEERRDITVEIDAVCGHRLCLCWCEDRVRISHVLP